MEPLSPTGSSWLPPPHAPAPVPVPAAEPASVAPVSERVPMPGEGTSSGPVARPLPMAVWRYLAVGGYTLVAALVAWQLARVFGGTERSSLLSWTELVAAFAGLAGMLVWTWVVVENARRLLAAATTQAPPEPNAVVAAWIPALVVAVVAGGVAVYLQRRLVLPENDTSSALPLAVAAGALLVVLMLAIRPLNEISHVLRRLGGAALPVARVIWVPLALAVIGGGSIAVMRTGDLFGDDFEGIAPAWALAVVLVVPVVIGLGAMWRGAIAAEDTVQLAYDRRNGVARTGVRRRTTLLNRALRAEAFPRRPRADTRRIRLVPGANGLRLLMFTGLAALSLVAIVAALVMVLFWRESRNGLLVPAQEDRAWEVLASLQGIQRGLALLALGATTLWAFVSVLNARLASGRRRNPVVAAAAWPAAAYGIWWIADRTADEGPGVVLAGFAAQAVVFAVPFLLLERAAIAVQVHRAPLRLSYGLGVVLLVLSQGLYGLATLERSSDASDVGTLAGSLAVSALLQLVATISVGESSRLIADGAAGLAADHNALVDRQRVAATIDRSGAGPGADQNGAESVGAAASASAPVGAVTPPTA